MRGLLRTIDARRAWNLVLFATFLPGAAWWMFIVLIQPHGLGSHANIYTGAAAAWLGGLDPWAVGPPAAVFAGPPTMLLPFVPFVGLPQDVTRLLWFGLDLVLAAWVVRRLGLPAYWLAFPPLFSAVILGHIEVVILAAMVVGGALSGVAALVKPYLALPLLAERRWSAFLAGAVVLGATLPFLPWGRFILDYEAIAATLARQDTGDSVFGNPVLMAVAGLALLALGPRRALWLAVPVIWPHAQAIYKTMTIPVLTPVVALFWALPFEGATLAGIVVFAGLVQAARFRALPGWLRVAIEPVVAPKEPLGRRIHVPADRPAHGVREISS